MTSVRLLPGHRSPSGGRYRGQESGNDWGAGPDSGELHTWGAATGPEGEWHAEPEWPNTDEWAAGHRNEGSDPAADKHSRRASGAHRVPVPPAALKGRAAVVAVAAGAVVAAGQAGMASASQQHRSTTDYDAAGQAHQIAPQAASTPAQGQAQQGKAAPAAAGDSQAPQVLNVAPVADMSQFQDILHHGQEYASHLAAKESAKLRPMFVKFANGTFTSGFGGRWGVQHMGVDVSAPIGTPIYAVADGTVISAGPASGFGMWVRLQHDDGTITVYGHVNTATVSVGQRVMAGDQIATVGNRGFSTGPHCHFEVWQNGKDKI
ncbi:MAG: M23 family metallopeptidase, partial [Nocardia sp.]|nr:M23 family metallopeptidase [Nocardia sp.]